MLSKINEAYCDKDGHPFQDIRIYHTVVLDDPFPDVEGVCVWVWVQWCVECVRVLHAGMVVPERSPSPPKEVNDSSRIGAEEDIDDFKVCDSFSLTLSYPFLSLSLSLSL